MGSLLMREIGFMLKLIIAHLLKTQRSSLIVYPGEVALYNMMGKKYNYFVFWTSILNNSPSTVEIEIKFPAINFFNSNKSHFKVAFTKAEMTPEKVQELDYGLTDIPSLLTNESNQVKYLKKRISSQKEYSFYIPVFIHKTKWPVRAEIVVKSKKLFYKITAGTDSVMVPCGGINFLN